jgi:hypothetical protein
MQNTARLFNCARCHCQTKICSGCDRGNLYCGPACSRAARAEKQRAAGRRYQAGRKGRFTHAARQRRYRRRRMTKVTHQGSTSPLADDVLGTTSKKVVAPPFVSAVPCIVCDFCGRICSAVLRPGYLSDTRTDRFSFRRPF